MYPILGRYGPFLIYSYTVVLGVGIFLGIGLTARQARQTPRPHWFDGIMVILATGLIGGRAGFVWGHWGYFAERPHEIWQVAQGGLSYHGALLAGLPALWIWSRRQRADFVAYAGLLAPALALGNAFGWLACWLAGCGYGRATTLGPFSADLPDEFGIFAVRYQTQLLGIGFSLILFFLAIYLRPRRSPGTLFWFTLWGLSIGRILVASLRGDPVPYLRAIRVDIILDITVAFLAWLLLKYRYPIMGKMNDRD